MVKISKKVWDLDWTENSGVAPSFGMRGGRRNDSFKEDCGCMMYNVG